MTIFTKANQGGSIRTYLIVAVVFVVIFVLSLNFIQQRGEQVRKDQAIAQAEEINREQNEPSATEQPSNQPTTGEQQPNTEPNNTPAEEELDTIPQTGAGDVLVYGFVSIYTGLFVAYLNSRHILKRSL